MNRIFAYLPGRALGDFVAYAALVASIKEQFDEAELNVCFRNDRPYKDPIVQCIWNAKSRLSLPPGEPGVPLDYFDDSHGNPTQKNRFWTDNQLQRTNIVLSGRMLDELMLNSISTTTLCPPADQLIIADQKLIALGLDPKRWIAAIYWKEEGYQFRGINGLRTIYDPAPYFAAIHYIVEKLGGQVVRLGHQTPTVIPKLRGVVDLAKIENSEFLQLCAVARSRFMVASASGPASYGSAFGVPTATTDQTLCIAAWNEDDYIVTQGFEMGGEILRQQDAFDAGCLFGTFDHTRATYHRNTVDEVVAATDEMFRATTDCPGWRAAVPRQVKGPRNNYIVLPPPQKFRPELMVPPSLRRYV